MNDRDERAELAAAHALGSSTPDEDVDYRAYLAESDAGRSEAVGFARVADALGADAPEAVPSADLKARLMAQIAVRQQLPAATEAAAPEAVVRAAENAPAVEGPATPAERRARERWFRRPVVIVAAAAAAVVLFAGGTVVGVSIGSNAVVSAQQAQELAQISAASDVRRSTAPVSGGGAATLVWSNELGKSAMIVNGVAAPGNGKTFQLWYIRDGKAISAGLMSPSSTSSWQVLAGTMKSGDTVGITVEPGGGSKQPTTKPVVAITS